MSELDLAKFIIELQKENKELYIKNRDLIDLNKELNNQNVDLFTYKSKYYKLLKDFKKIETEKLKPSSSMPINCLLDLVKQ
jgi:hypothetical protein